MKIILKRFPFTLTMLALLGLTALWTNTHTGTISAEWLDRLGFAPLDLLALNLGRLFTSALVTSGGRVFWEALGMVAFAVGLSEWLAGSRRAALTFWGVHFSTLLIESLFVALPVHLAGSTLGSLIALTRDVGPSAGYFGALGLVSAHLKSPWNLISGGVILVALEIALLHVSGNNTLGMEVGADIAHIIAFPLGWYSSRLANNTENNNELNTTIHAW
ncbi:MAG: hypothetical protein PVJ21_08035 [Anaerolineales bacterium]|jgi:hypothetical protein